MKYLDDLIFSIKNLNLKKIEILEKLIVSTHKKRGVIYLCGNGGSAANADHICNDLSLGFTKKKRGFNFISLNSNLAVITCIANDLSYGEIYSQQIKNIASNKDLLVVLSGSGNSKNIINVIKEAKNKKMNVFGIYGFDGGKAKKITKNYIHINIKDMQVSEDMQMIIFNLVMKNLIKRKFFKLDNKL